MIHRSVLSEIRAKREVSTKVTITSNVPTGKRGEGTKGFGYNKREAGRKDWSLSQHFYSIMAPKLYAVRKGRSVGVFQTWDECSASVKGFPGNEYKSFSTLTEAQEYLQGSQPFQNVQDNQGATSKATNHTIHSVSSKGEKRPSEKPVEYQPAHKEIKVAAINDSDGCFGHGKQRQPNGANEGPYFLEFDGASKGNPGRAGAGVVVRYPDGSLFCNLKEGVGIATNNVAEYRSLIRGLKFCLENGIHTVRVQGDSNLVCMQIQDKWQTKNANIMELSKEAKQLKSRFKYFHIQHVLREYNSGADALANEALSLSDGQWVLEMANQRGALA